VSLAYELERDLAQRTAERDALAEEVDRLRLQVEISDHCVAVLKAERDEARRMYCRAYTDLVVDPRLEKLSLEDAAAIVADDLGWDCFDAKEVQR
jgi:hypothetical protein